MPRLWHTAGVLGRVAGHRRTSRGYGDASRQHAERWCCTALGRAQAHGIPFVVKHAFLHDLDLPGAVFGVHAR